MKIKSIKQILTGLYMQGIYDGIDVIKAPRDRFLGNSLARKVHEKEVLVNAYQELKKLVK